MLGIDQARRLVLETARPLAVVVRPIGDALGLVLAEDITSDLDMPPYDKALVDGYAVRSADLLPAGRGRLQVVEEVYAGQAPSRSVGSGEAVRIMTGAPLPAGADAVVMVERTSREPAVGGAGGAADGVSIDDPRLRAGQNIMRRATELAGGDTVLRAGTAIRPPEIGILAAVGRSSVAVHPAPRVAVLSTGNELVEAAEQPGAAQIRNSNGPTLLSLICRAGGHPQYLGIAADSRDSLTDRLRSGLEEADLVILSGGVSAGELDLVPAVLAELGVRQLFHKVDLKPGKPVWFGAAAARGGTGLIGASPPDQSRQATLVFGLPGNPVSAVVCFELFVRPAIRTMMGCPDPGPRMTWATLTEDKHYRTDRPTYWPAKLEQAEHGYQVQPVAWHGSPDLRALGDANAFVLFAKGDYVHRKGDRLPVLVCDW